MCEAFLSDPVYARCLAHYFLRYIKWVLTSQCMQVYIKTRYIDAKGNLKCIESYILNVIHLDSINIWFVILYMPIC
jgi:hypothetical protein